MGAKTGRQGHERQGPEREMIADEGIRSAFVAGQEGPCYSGKSRATLEHGSENFIGQAARLGDGCIIPGEGISIRADACSSG